MDTNYEELVKDILNSNDDTKTKIERLKEKIAPYSSRTELKEILDNIILEDTDYIRRYIKNSSNIAYQKDFIIDNKDKYVYRGTFNNDSEYLGLRDAAIMLAFQDYALYSSNYDYYTDVYVNGVKLLYGSYMIRNSHTSEHEHFYTGSKRLFIEPKYINDNDIVSVVVKKSRKTNKFYKTIEITDTRTLTYTFNKNEVGDFVENVDNLLLYKKGINDNCFILVDDKNYSLLTESNNLTLNILEVPILGDTYLVINRLKNVEYTFTNESKLTEEEYIERFAIMNTELVDKNTVVNGCYLPIPVRNINDIEVFIDGYRLVPNYDFTFISHPNQKNQYIQYAGILKQNSIITMRNKPFSKEFGFLHQEEEITKEGFVDLSKYNIPISEDYIEVFVGRRRVPLDQKRSVINRLIKIDSQQYLQRADIFPEVEHNLVVTELLTQYRNDTNKSVIAQVGNLFPDLLVSNWKDNNELRPNSGDGILDDIFIGRINRIELIADSTVVTEGRSPHFKVIGYYSDDTEMAMDITDYSEISSFNKYAIGRQQVIARYVQGNEVLEAILEVEVILKEILELKIITNSNFYVIGDNIKETVKVFAIFEDNSSKDVTNQCIINAEESAAEIGYSNISITFDYNGRTLTANKTVLVSDSSQRKIVNMEVLLDNYVKDSNNYSELSVYVTYNNNIIQKINPECLTVYQIIDDVEIEIPDISKCEFTDFVNAINLKVEVFTSAEKLIKVEFLNEDTNTTTDFGLASIFVLQDVISEDNRYIVYDEAVANIDEKYLANIPNEYKLYRIKNINNEVISIGSTNIMESLICPVISNEELIIVEFLDDNTEVLAQMLFRTKNANSYRKTVEGRIEGTAVTGYNVIIDKFTFGSLLKDLNLTDVKLLDNDYNVIARFNDEGYTKATDEASETESLIYFKFNNFATRDGNVKNITEYLYNQTDDTKLYLDVSGYEKLVDLHLPEISFGKLELNLSDDIWIDRTSDDYYLVLQPELDEEIAFDTSYEVRPNNVNIIQTNYSSKIKLQLQADTSNEIYLTKNRYGLNRYYFVSSLENLVFYIDITIDEVDDITRITKINDIEFTFDMYNSIKVKYA